ncbi:MAG: hypothetical protein K9W45_03465 [Candidatus Heimdallarchaeum aukensis]|uniref:PepSY domain-containing protein n=1 Tax=Candidatus Heimdallarchaeum aukensis TaxID=2876573 RepID=A0A9Y1FLM9_9ARCH|nr:MAG: hypothetical protein K9W45_03465 [Candidatus Heimdallarchaeum aukensis]
MNLKQKILVTAFMSLFISSIAIGIVVGTNAKKNKELPPIFINNEQGNDENTSDNTDYTEYNDTIPAKLTEEQVKNIAKSDPTIQEFLSNYSSVEEYCYYDGFGYWYVEFYADDWMSYAYAIVEDNTGEVVESEAFYYSDESNLTEEQVIAIALENEEVKNFIEQNPEYEVYAYYDFYQYWFVDFYDEYYFSWCTVTIDDVTGEIVDVYSSEDIYNTTLTPQEVVEIALTDPDVQTFITNNPDYEVYVYLMDWFYCYDEEFGDNMTVPEIGEINDNNGDEGTNTINTVDTENGEIGYPIDYSTNVTWVVGFYNYNYTDWIELYIDDTTGEIIDKLMTTPAIHTEEEIKAIALALPEVQEFLANVEDTEMYIWYDGFGYWYIDIYSSFSWEAYLFAEIDDITGEVIYLEYYIPEPPLHTEQEVEKFALTLPEVQQFIQDNPDYEMWISFSYGYWYVELYSNDNGGLWIEIIDDNGNGELEVTYLEFFDYVDVEF